MTESLQPAKYIIGIDLGTTNSTVAYAVKPDEEAAQGPEIHQLSIPQIGANGAEEARMGLPSFVYLPLPQELEAKQFAVSWDVDRAYCVGAAAKARGAELPGRLVLSAKSWLCHSQVDRRAPILPWGADEVEQKLSPVTACQRYLEHIQEVWNQAHPDSPFVEQEVLLTVPASFDPDARQLVQEACESAGYPPVVLLEEPQAAFYAWLHQQGDAWRKQLKVGEKVLVVDLGGGTSDFSLIEVGEDEGDLTLERLAVGEHLLLGGDNMDLALAYLAKAKLEEQGHELDEWQFQSLVHSAREAKEELLAAKDDKTQVELLLQGRGSGLVASSLTVALDKEEVQAFLLDGFFPLLDASVRPIQGRTGIQDLGLPYVNDARMSAHLAAFVGNGAVEESFPQHILFNGGVFKGDVLRKRVLEQLGTWAAAHCLSAPLDLGEANLDCAVSRGAVYYGFARQGQGIRIKSGTSRSYFIGVEEAVPAVPGMPRPLRAVCVVPFGMEEGSECHLEGEGFALVLGEPATFRFFSRSSPQLSNGDVAEMGTIVRRWQSELTELHPVETVLDRGQEACKTVRVQLRSCVTELGVLELWCQTAGGQAWKLEFDVRHEEPQLLSV